MCSPTVVPFCFRLTHPVLYAHSIIIQGVDYADAAQYAQAHCAGTLWTITSATNTITGEVVQND